MTNTAISVNHISKWFKIPLDRSSTLKYRLSHLRSSSRYRKMSALNDISFEVKEGEFLGIIGANGSGKSTLLKVLARIYPYDAGSLAINGLVSPFLELGVGFNTELTARENIYLGGAVLGLTRKYLTSHVDQIIQFADLEKFADQKVKNYSSGMQVRLAFSLAIQSYADILLMDEVLAVGDANFQAKCFDVFSQYKRQAKTIVLVSHDLGSIRQYCDRVILIHEGSLVADGDPRSVIGQYVRIMGEAQNPDEASPIAQKETGLQSIGTKLAIRDIRLTSDGQERSNKMFYSGKPMEINATLENKLADDITVTCNGDIYRLDGSPVVGFSMKQVLAPPILIGPRGTANVTFSIPSLPILDGAYYFSFVASDPESRVIYDRINEASTFHVVDEQGRGGLFAFDGTWSTQDQPLGLLPTQPLSKE